MQVGTGKSILNGIAIAKSKIYKAPKLEIPQGIMEQAARDVGII